MLKWRSGRGVMAYQIYSPAPMINGAYIRSLDVTANRDDTTEINMTLIPDEQTIKYFINMMKGDLPPGNTMGLHLIENEFICAWCGSVNPITDRFCGKCGAPRGFVLQSWNPNLIPTHVLTIWWWLVLMSNVGTVENEWPGNSITKSVDGERKGRINELRHDETAVILT